MKPRRVLHISRCVGGGVAVVVDLLATLMDRERYEPIVLFDTIDQSDLRKKLSKSEIKTIDFKKCRKNQLSTLSPKLNYSLKISEKLEAQFGTEVRQIYLSFKTFYTFLTKQAPMIKSFVKVFKDFRVDLIHTHSDLRAAKPEIIAAWLAGIPCISHNHGYRKFNCIDKMFGRFVDAFIHISRDVAEHNIRQGKLRSKGIIIYNSVDMSKFTKSYNTELVRKEFGIKPDETLIGIIGRMDWWKGHDYFLEAMAKSATHIGDLRAIIIGAEIKDAISNLYINRRYYRKIKSLIQTLNLADRIILTEYRDDVPRLLAALDVFVHASSIPEPFGIAIIEGMAAGKPVVATAAGGVLEIIEDGVNGLLVPCKDSDAMARAILKIISYPDRANQMGMAARRRVAEKFTAHHQVKAVEKLYDDILANPKRKKKFWG